MTLQTLEHAVFIQNQQIKTNSLKVAEVFAKRHTNILRAIESLDCSSEFNELNFEPVEYKDAKGESRPMYEMTKDGFIFLVMGFTGVKAAQFKEAYINAFNHMAAMLHNQKHELTALHEGALVRFKSGSPQLLISKLIYSNSGQIDQAEVTWFHQHRLFKQTVSVHCLTTDQVAPMVNQKLKEFWQAVNHYGISNLNHAKQIDTIALNLSQLYATVKGLPPRTELLQMLPQSQSPHPTFVEGNTVLKSVLTDKSVRCWVFKHSNHVALQQNV